MARAAGIVLVLLASASIALGSPVCCLVGHPCCGTEATADVRAAPKSCCSHCKKQQTERPAPKPGPAEKKGCMCRDIEHATSAEHVPLVAVLDAPAIGSSVQTVKDLATTSDDATPASHAPRSHPLLL